MNSNAPPVDFPVGRFFMDAWIAIFLSLLSGLAIALLYFLGEFSSRLSSLLMCTWLVLTLISAAYWRRSRANCWLSWDGLQWHILPLMPPQFPGWKGTGRAADSHAIIDVPLQDDHVIVVHLDLQKYLFVSLSNNAGSKEWFWLAHTSFPERWHGFRCVVYSSSE